MSDEHERINRIEQRQIKMIECLSVSMEKHLESKLYEQKIFDEFYVVTLVSEPDSNPPRPWLAQVKMGAEVRRLELSGLPQWKAAVCLNHSEADQICHAFNEGFDAEVRWS